MKRLFQQRNMPVIINNNGAEYKLRALFLCSQEYTFINNVWHSWEEPSEEDED